MNQTLYLVTGAAGFLGGNICRQLIAKGEKVRAFVLPNDKAIKYVPKECEIATGDLTDLVSLEKFFHVEKGIETIVMHIASIVTVNPDYNQKVMDVNVEGTRNIVNLCKAHKEVKKLVYCSSTGAIPEEKKGIKIKESNDFTTLNPEKVVGCYSQSKAMATEIVLEAAKEGLNACVIHPSGILGPVDYAVGEVTSTMIKIIDGNMPMGIDGSFNLADVRDLARGAILAAEKGKRGECYILGNDEVSFRDFSKLVSQEAHTKKVKVFLPIWMANGIAKSLEKKAKKEGKKPLMTTFSVYNLARNNDFDSSKAEKELGYTTRPYQETIHDMVAWLQDEHLIQAR